LDVNAYIIDTGIDKLHADLDDNVVDHVNFHGGENTDCNGHGTHVAGTVAAEDNRRGVVGVAPGARLIGVKVIGCKGSGWLSNVIKGVDWVTDEEQKPRNANRPAIANMSLSTEASLALDRAVKESAISGVFYSVAAGNDGRSACKYSPARAGAGTNNGIVTTAATDRANEVTSFSNYGRCVDLWAPGKKILSTRLGGGTATKSGTSMAAPHVGGTGALYLSSRTRAAPKAAEEALRADSKVIRTEDRRRILLVYAGEY
jgi:subtilisin family serine protease